MNPLRLSLVTVLLLAGLSSSLLAAAAKKLPFHGKVAAVDTAAQTVTLSGKSARVFHLTSTTKITDGAGNPSSLAAATVGEDVGGSYTKEADGTLSLNSIRFGAKTGSKEAAAEASAPAPAPAPKAPSTPPAPSLTSSSPGAVAAAVPTPTPAPEPAPAAPAAAGKKQRFSGKVVSVDAAANTLVVHGKSDQTFTVTPASKITDATGAAAPLSAFAAGEKVSGTYVKSADGATMTVATLKAAK